MTRMMEQVKSEREENFPFLNHTPLDAHTIVGDDKRYETINYFFFSREKLLPRSAKKKIVCKKSLKHG